MTPCSLSPALGLRGPCGRLWGQRWPPLGRAPVVQSSCLDSCLKCFLEDVVFEIGFVFLKKKINQCKCVFEACLGFFFKITVIKKRFFCHQH